MSSATWTARMKTRNRQSRTAQSIAFCRDRGIAGLSVIAGICCVPISIAVSEIFLTAGLVARLAGFGRHPATFRPPRVFWFWLVWAGFETVIWLHSPDLSAGNGEMRHLLLIAALFTTLPALNRAIDHVRVWKGIFATATVGSVSLILGYFDRLTRYHDALAAGGDPSFYLRTGGLLHHWAIYGSVEILVFGALLEFRAAYAEQRRWINPALAVHAVAILLSLTRGLWCSALLVLALHLVSRRSKCIWLLPLVSALAMVLSPYAIRHRFAQTFQSDYYSNAERVQMWRVGWRMIREQPVFGVGPGRVEALYCRYLSPGEPTPAYHGHLHNNALQLGAQFGVLVLGAALVFVSVLLWDLAGACTRAVDRERKSYGHSLGLILLAFAVLSALIDTNADKMKRRSPVGEQLLFSEDYVGCPERGAAWRRYGGRSPQSGTYWQGLILRLLRTYRKRHGSRYCSHSARESAGEVVVEIQREIEGPRDQADQDC